MVLRASWWSLLMVLLVACEIEKRENLDLMLAKIVSASGDVRTWSRARSAFAWESASIGQWLFAGDKVQTAENATAIVSLTSGGDLSIGPGSIVVIEPPEDGTAGRVAVETGEIDGVFTSSAANAELLLATEEGGTIRIAREPGTGRMAYRVKARDEGVLEVAVTEGRAEVIEESGRAERLSRDQALDVRGRRFRGAVLKLPAAPLASAPEDGAERPMEEIDLGWRKRNEATSYRIQIAKDYSFTEIIRDTSTPDVVIRFAPPSPGIYYWRVAASDERGRSSDFGSPRALRIVEQIDLLIAPPDKAEVSFWKVLPTIRFSWSELAPNTRHILIIARDPSLRRRIAISERTSATAFETRRLDAGVYYWGVFTEDDRTPLFTRSRRLSIRREQLRLKVQKRLSWE